MIVDTQKLTWPIPPKGCLSWEQISEDLSHLHCVSHFEPRWYYPGQNPTLFSRFGALEATKERIIEFAETFGVLWGEGKPYWIPGEEPYFMEDYRQWDEEIRRFKFCYKLWRALKRDDEDALGRVYAEFEGVTSTLGSATDVAPELVWRDIGHQIIYSIGRLQVFVDESLNMAYRVRSGGGLDFSFLPGSLIELIWLQLAQAVMSNDRWMFCDFCGEPFKPESLKARYCSDSHRQLAYRKRKQSKK